MICYFVSNQNSPYYQSNVFTRILHFVQKNTKKCNMKQANNKLSLTFENVNTIGKAIVQFYKDMAAWPVRRGATNMQLLFADLDATNDGIPDTSAIPAPWNAITAANRISLEFNLVNNANNYPRAQVIEGVSWNGPYLSSVRPDPWGNPYMVNAQWLWDTTTIRNVYVLSAGPARPASVETPFNGVFPAGSDDIVFRIQ